MRTAKLNTASTSADPRLRFHHGERVEIIDSETRTVQRLTITAYRVRLQSGDEITVYADQLKAWRGKL